MTLCGDCHEELPEGYTCYRNRCTACWKQWEVDNYRLCVRCNTLSINRSQSDFRTHCIPCWKEKMREGRTRCSGCKGTKREYWYSVPKGSELCGICTLHRPIKKKRAKVLDGQQGIRRFLKRVEK